MTFLYRHRKSLLIVTVVLALLVALGQVARARHRAPVRHGKRVVCTYLGVPTYVAAKRLHPHWGPWELYWADHHCEVKTWTY